jgi:23S rRNA (cytosine1962-C5)-methyltransferase
MSVESRLNAALARRAALAADPQTNAYRLIHGAADGFADLAVDRYADTLVAHLYTHGRRVTPPTRLLATLAERASARSVYIKYRPDQASVLDEAAREELAPRAPLLGPPVDELEVLENGLRFIVRPAEGLSPGLFLDMRETRAWVRAQAAGCSVLNCFAYTCGFGIAAWRGGATRAANLDISRRYLEWGQASAALNGLSPPRTDFIFGDVFDWLKRFRRAGTTFDLVILDPPSYATTKRSRFVASRDYARLVALAAPVVTSGGRLVACANASSLTASAFSGLVHQGLAQTEAGVAGAKVGPWQHEPALDFPVVTGDWPYLKVLPVTLTRA